MRGTLLAVLFIAACGDSSAAPGPVDAATIDAPPIGGSRPITLHLPPSYQVGTPMPLVLMLHGYSFSGFAEELYLQLTPVADARGFIYAYADGTIDQDGNPFWNATDACCDLYHTGVDDSTYLSQVITDVEARYSVDPKRVFVIGHSNGAFMANRLACDHADQIAAIASLAGAQWSDLSKCTPSAPVAMLQIHGDADTTIPYAGGNIGLVSFPGAQVTVADWAMLDGCTTTLDSSAAPLDIDFNIPGAETLVTSYHDGCHANGGATLWTIQGGNHIPAIGPAFDAGVIDFFFAHPKP